MIISYVFQLVYVIPVIRVAVYEEPFETQAYTSFVEFLQILIFQSVVFVSAEPRREPVVVVCNQITCIPPPASNLQLNFTRKSFQSEYL